MNLNGQNNEDLPPDGQIFNANWAQNADLLYPSTMRIVINVLETLISDGIYSEERIGNLIGYYSLRWPVPAQSLRIAQDFIREFCMSAARPNQETMNFLTCVRPIQKHHKCFVVFYGGHDNYYYDMLPEEILVLRKTILFWIYPAQHEFYSQGEKNKKSLPPKAINILKFLCCERNAGNITISDIYKYAWQKNQPNEKKKIISVEVAMSALNDFTNHILFGKTVQSNKLVIRDGKCYTPKKDLISQCCIINEINWDTPKITIHRKAG